MQRTSRGNRPSPHHTNREVLPLSAPAGLRHMCVSVCLSKEQLTPTIGAEQHHVLKALLRKELAGQVVVAGHHPAKRAQQAGHGLAASEGPGHRT